jgi:hypothetical protein
MKTTHWTLTVAAILLALPSWTTICVRADEAEGKAVNAIQKLGGRITRDMKATDNPIVSVDLGKTKVTDAGLKDLAGLKQLQWLNLTKTQVTDAGLKHLAGLKQLRELDLRNIKVTDAGLKHLAGLKQLRLLLLTNTKVTDKGIADLKKALPNLVIE